ncbi:capsular polysaccharide synthesis protein [Sphingomonas sp. F9_3S_D5_B_2]
MILNWFVRHKRFGRFKAAFDRPTLPMRPLSTFPRVIHLYWDQGFDGAPDIVSTCVESWRERNPGWTLRFWDAAAAEQLVSRSSLPAGLKTTPYSDMLRTEILHRHGGVWADSTVYCLRPLDSWLLHIMCQTDFFAFSRPGPDRAMATWFLAARAGSNVAGELSAAVRRFWSRQDQPTRVYHWYQYIFEYLERTSASFRKAWATAPKISPAGMLMVQGRLVSGATPTEEELELWRAMPMQKLTYKHPIDIERMKSILD